MSNHLKPMKRRRFDSLGSIAFGIPSGVADVRVECPNCKNLFAPAWLEKWPPLAPYAPVNHTDTGRWIPTAATIPCPECHSNCSLKLPVVKGTSTYHYYGDEAYRLFEDWGLMVYTMVGNNKNNVEGDQELIRDFKHSHFPGESPKDWSLHSWELFNRRQREKLERYYGFTDSEAVRVLSELGNQVQELTKGLFIAAAITPFRLPNGKRERKKVIDLAKRQCFTSLLLFLIDTHHQQGIYCDFFFDQSGKDGWAKDAFDAARATLIFPYLAKGMEVEDPKFIEPGSHVYSEIADAVSFTIARFLQRGQKGAHAELDPAIFGRITYVASTVGGGTLMAKRSTGLPREWFKHWPRESRRN